MHTIKQSWRELLCTGDICLMCSICLDYYVSFISKSIDIFIFIYLFRGVSRGTQDYYLTYTSVSSIMVGGNMADTMLHLQASPGCCLTFAYTYGRI